MEKTTFSHPDFGEVAIIETERGLVFPSKLIATVYRSPRGVSGRVFEKVKNEIVKFDGERYITLQGVKMLLGKRTAPERAQRVRAFLDAINDATKRGEETPTEKPAPEKCKAFETFDELENRAQSLFALLRGSIQYGKLCVRQGLEYKKDALHSQALRTEGVLLREVLGHALIQKIYAGMNFDEIKKDFENEEFTPTDVAEFVAHMDIETTAEGVNDFLVRMGYQKETPGGKARYDVADSLGSQYGSVRFIDEKETGRKYWHLRWTRKGRALIVGALYFFNIINKYTLFE